MFFKRRAPKTTGEPFHWATNAIAGLWDELAATHSPVKRCFLLNTIADMYNTKVEYSADVFPDIELVDLINVEDGFDQAALLIRIIAHTEHRLDMRSGRYGPAINPLDSCDERGTPEPVLNELCVEPEPSRRAALVLRYRDVVRGRVPATSTSPLTEIARCYYRLAGLNEWEAKDLCRNNRNR